MLALLANQGRVLRKYFVNPPKLNTFIYWTGWFLEWFTGTLSVICRILAIASPSSHFFSITFFERTRRPFCPFQPFWILCIVFNLTISIRDDSSIIVEPIRGWQWCWWHRYISDFMMVTDFRFLWQNHYVGDFFIELNRSPTSWIGHQHLKLVTNTFGPQHPSPTSM